jgi:hypothetical protein
MERLLCNSHDFFQQQPRIQLPESTLSPPPPPPPSLEKNCRQSKPSTGETPSSPMKDGVAVSPNSRESSTAHAHTRNEKKHASPTQSPKRVLPLFPIFLTQNRKTTCALSETFFFTSCCCCCYRDLTERLSDKISQMQNAAASTITLYPPHETQDKNPTKKEKKATPPKKILSNLKNK